MTPLSRPNDPDETAGPAEAGADIFVFPTSFAQQRLWFLDQLVPRNAFYNVDSAIRMTMRPPDVPVLERSLHEIVRRHESLRTTFKAVDGQPVQVVSPQVRVELPIVDLRRVPLPLRQGEALRRATEEAGQPFDLSTSPLLRATLLRTDEAEYIFLLTMHHIIADGWSIGVFWSELTTIWRAFERGLPSPLPALPIQYADFAVWQRAWLDEGGGEGHLEYWKRQLADLPVTQMPTDWARPEAQLFGSMDFCACDECRSILSPAAYLVDLLNFLDQPSAPDGNPQDVLFERRPDLQHLPLTCENTNTALPYIDVVLETLEYFVANEANPFTLTGYAGHDTGTTLSEDLLATPQFVTDAAYDTLVKQRFPLRLPFHKSLEELRRYFDALEVPLTMARVGERA